MPAIPAQPTTIPAVPEAVYDCWWLDGVAIRTIRQGEPMQSASLTVVWIKYRVTDAGYELSPRQSDRIEQTILPDIYAAADPSSPLAPVVGPVLADFLAAITNISARAAVIGVPGIDPDPAVQGMLNPSSLPGGENGE